MNRYFIDFAHLRFEKNKFGFPAFLGVFLALDLLDPTQGSSFFICKASFCSDFSQVFFKEKLTAIEYIFLQLVLQFYSMSRLFLIINSEI